MRQKRLVMKRMLALLMAALLLLQPAGLENLFGTTVNAAQTKYTYAIHIYRYGSSAAPTVKDLDSGQNLELSFAKNNDDWWIATLETTASHINAQVSGESNMGSFGDGSFTLSPDYSAVYLWYLGDSNSNWATAYVTAASDGSAKVSVLGWKNDGSSTRAYSVTGGLIGNWDSYQALNLIADGSTNFPAELIPAGKLASSTDGRALFQKTYTGFTPGETYYFRLKDSYGSVNTEIPNSSKAACFTVPEAVSDDSHTFTFNFHYFRFAGDYSDWGLHIWQEDGGSAKTVNFTSADAEGWVTAKYTVTSEAEAAKVGFLLKKGDWADRDITASRYVEITQDDAGLSKDIWLVQYDAAISESKESTDLSPRAVSAMADSKLAVSAFITGKSADLTAVDDTKFYIYNESDDVKIPDYTSARLSGDNYKVKIKYPGEVFIPNKLYSVRHEDTGAKIWGSVTMRDILNNYTYSGSDLGLTYSVNTSVFKLWAPTAKQVRLLLYNSLNYSDEDGDFDTNGRIKETKRNAFDQANEMSYDGLTGVWSGAVNDNLDGWYYLYEVTQPDGTVSYAVDPYAHAVSANGQLTAIIDQSTTGAVKPVADTYDIDHAVDQVLYELHVRDFSIDSSSGIQNKGKYLGFTETGTTVNQTAGGAKTGIDHLKELGVTTVHLLPSFDFASVNELGDLSYGASNAFNWGYDPQNYNVPEGSYATDPTDPAKRIEEFKAMVNALHEAGIRVVMDVVYNHTYSIEDGPFQKAVPNYFYRTNDLGFYTDGSGCGNEVASEQDMVRKYIVDSVLYWQNEYGIDGFRFDLMALIDITTMSELTQALKAKDPDCIIYGEPWTGGGTALSGALQTIKGTQKDRGFAVFNDYFRGLLKGGSDDSTKGFATELTGKEKEVMSGVKGSFYTEGGGDGVTNRASETVNYVTAHDNLNLWDKIRSSYGYGGGLAADPYGGTADNVTVAKQSDLLMMGMIFTSQGIPFFQAGDEFLRSKYGNHNSYNAGDEINAIDWTNKTSYTDVFAYYQGLLQLRREHPAFRLDSTGEIDQAVEHIRNANGVIAYRLKNYAGGDSWKNIYVLYNGSSSAASFTGTEVPAGLICVVNDTQAGTAQIGSATGGGYLLPAHTMAVLYEGDVQTREPQLAAVAVSPKTLSMTAGEKTVLRLKGLDTQSKPYSLGNAAVTWSSDQPSVVKIDASSGQAEAVGAGKATISAKTTLNGKTYTAECQITVAAAKKYIVFEYDGINNYPDSQIYVWVAGGAKGTLYNFNQTLGLNGACTIELPAAAQRVGYIVLRNGNWDTCEPNGGRSVDRFIDLSDTEPYTKVLIQSGTANAIVYEQAISKLDMRSRTITFYYRDLNLYRQSNQAVMDPVPLVKVTSDGGVQEYEMTYEASKQCYTYELTGIAEDQRYSYQFSRDGRNTWFDDPYRTESYFDTANLDISAGFAHSSFHSGQLNVLSVKGGDIVSVTADLTELGGDANVTIDSVTAGKCEKTISIPSNLSTGLKHAEVTVTTKGGSVYVYSVPVTVEQQSAEVFDWDEARIYFLLTDRFAKGAAGEQTTGASLKDYHGGDFKGLISKLDYLKELGVNTVWITPIVDNIDFAMEGGGTGYHGYWAKSFEAIDEHLGTLEDFESLIQAIHQNGMKLMVDVVLNHAGYGMDGYVSPAWTGTLPNASEIGAFMPNGTSMFRGALEVVNHDVLSNIAGMPDLRTEDMAVRQQIVAWQTKWMTDYDIDYFRVDTVKHVDHLTWQAFKNAVITENPNFKMIGELFDNSVGTAAQSDYHNIEEMDSLLDFNFKYIARSFVQEGAALADVKTALEARDTLLTNQPMLSLGQFLSSHDEDGFATRLTGTDAEKFGKLMAAAGLQITSRGQPVIYYGEEIGLSGRNSNDENRYDFDWNYADNANEKQMHDHYQALLQVREKYSKVFSKGSRIYTAANANVLLVTAAYQGETVITAINRSMSAQTVNVSVSAFAEDQNLLDEYAFIRNNDNLKIFKVSGDSITVTVPAAADGGIAVYAAAEELTAPESSAASGAKVVSDTKLTLTAAADAEIYYTIDGTSPITNGLKYEQPITLTGSPGTVITVKAYAKMQGYLNSEVAEFTYTIYTKLAKPDVSDGWDGVTARWGIVSNADNIVVQLKKDGSNAGTPITLSGMAVSHDFSQSIKDGGAGSYTYTVQALNSKPDIYQDSAVAESTPIGNYTVSYAAGGGLGSMASETALEGTDYTVKQNAFTPQAGYLFDCWQASGAATGIYAAGGTIEAISGDVTLTAQWSPLQLEAPTANITSGTKVASGTLLRLTAKEGAEIYYTIDGTDPAAGGLKYNGEITLTGNPNNVITVKAYAKMQGHLDSTAAEFTYTFNSKLVTPDISIGWDKTTARWSAVASAGSIVIQLKKDGSNAGAPITLDGTAVSYDFNQAIKDGGAGSYTYTVQALSSDTENYQDSEAAESASLRNYTITYAAGGGLGTMAAETALEGSVYTVKENTFEPQAGYTFDCWEASGAAAGTYSAGDTLEDISGDIALTARWNAPQLETPQASLAAGTKIASGTKLILTAKAGADIYYTIDGSNPTVEGLKYEEPIALTGSPGNVITVKAYVRMPGFPDSEVVDFNYTFHSKLAQPDVSAGWSSGTARWSAVSNAGSVVIQLKKDGSNAGDPVTLDGTAVSHDFSQAIKAGGAGSYTYTVQARSSNAEIYQDSEVSESTLIENYSITYAAGGGSGTMAAETALEGSDYTVKENTFEPQPGYTFDCWQASGAAAGTYAGGETLEDISGNVTLTAQWNAPQQLAAPEAGIAAGAKVISGTQLTLTAQEGAEIYYTIDGTNPTENGQKYIQPITLSGSPNEVVTVKAFASMEGHQDSEAAEFSYTIYTKLSKPDVTAGWNGGTARWTAAEHADNVIIQLKKDGSKAGDPVTLDGTAVSHDFSQAIKAGGEGSYTYTVQARSSNAEIYQDSEVSESTRIENYLITYAAGGGSGTMAAETALEGSDYTVKENTFEPQTGYTFDCWQASGAAAGTYAGGETLEDISGNVTLTAQWNAPQQLAAPEAGIAAGAKVISGTQLTLTAQEGAEIYYTIDGTNPTENGQKYIQPITLSGSPNEVVTVKAFASMEGHQDSEAAEFSYTIYTKLSKPDVTAGWNGGTARWTAVEHADNVIIQLKKDGSKAGDPVTLDGTAVSHDFSQAIKAGGAGSYTYTVQARSSNAEIYQDSEVSESTLIENYSITYAAGGGSGTMAAETALEGSDYTIKANNYVPQTGYMFDSWKADGVTYLSGSKLTAISGNVTLTAQWKPLEYKISYQLAGGTQAAGQSDKYTYGIGYTPKNPTRTGYTFSGWYSDSTYRTKLTGIAKTASGTVTLYAKWTANQYTVVFHKNGGSGKMSNQSHTYDGSQNLRKNTFTRKGYVFAGWSLTSKGAKKYTDKVNVKNLSDKAGGTVTLYAKWTKVKAPAKPKSLSVKSKKAKQLTVSYKKTSGAAGYKITYSTSSKFTGKTTKVIYTKNTSATLKNLKKGTKYYVKVAAYKTDSAKMKVIGKNTSVKSGTTKK